ncbi:MAG: neutral zinc metallopeptidase, partial [Chloroflexota bacterium]
MRLHSRFLVLLTLMLFWTPAFGLAWAQDEDEEDFDDYVEEVVTAADAYWRAQAQRLGFKYTTPDVQSIGYDERVRSKCGRSRGTNHSYCPAEARIYLDYDADEADSLSALWEDERPFVIVTIVGH